MFEHTFIYTIKQNELKHKTTNKIGQNLYSYVIIYIGK